MPKRGEGLIGALFAALRANGKHEFTRRDWTRLVNTVATTKDEVKYIKQALQQRGFTESVVRLTDKAKGRMGG